MIDAWKTQFAKRKNGIGSVYLVLILALVLRGISMSFVSSIVKVFLISGFAFALVITQFVDRMTLLCPNCHQSPISAMERGNAAHADFCVQCHFWLKSPSINHDDSQA